MMSEGAEAEGDILTLELGDLKETLVSTKRNGRRGRGLQNNFKKGGSEGARLVAAAVVTATSPLLPLSLSPPLHGGGGGASHLSWGVGMYRRRRRALLPVVGGGD
jgi:hypothetical protein